MEIVAKLEVTKHAPIIRFRGFKDPWVDKKLGQIATFSKGKGISKLDIDPEGKLPCIRYAELYTVYGEVIKDVVSHTSINGEELTLSKEDDVIIPASGETAIDIARAACVVDAGVALGGDLNIIRSKMDGTFLAYCLNGVQRIAIARFAQGSSVVHLYPSQLKLLKLHLPTLPEQQKIAGFLSAVDARIQQLTRKKALLEQYKKGVMQQLFPSAGSGQAPEIRFTRADGGAFPEWEEKRLGSISKSFSGGTPRTGTTEYYNGTIPFIRSAEINAVRTELHISEEGLSNCSAKMVQKGDLLFAMYGATAGEIGISRIEGAINQAILCIRLKKDDVFYVYSYFLFMKERILSTYLQGGQGNLSGGIVNDTMIPLPSLEEQQKIAGFLGALDARVQAVGEQLAGAQRWKKGLLQQMFV